MIVGVVRNSRKARRRFVLVSSVVLAVSSLSFMGGQFVARVSPGQFSNSWRQAASIALEHRSSNARSIALSELGDVAGGVLEAMEAHVAKHSEEALDTVLRVERVIRDGIAVLNDVQGMEAQQYAGAALKRLRRKLEK